MQHRTLRCPRATVVSATIAAAGAIGLSLLVAAPASAAPTASTVRVAAPTAATVGQPFDLDVTIPATTDVYAYEITLDADPDAVSLVDDSVTGPDGGFDRADQDADAITIVHTRLGTSPALSGDLDAGVSLTPEAAGETTLTVTRLVLVGSDGSTTTLADPASASVAVAGPSPSTPPTSGPTAGADPTGTPTSEPSGSATTPAGVTPVGTDGGRPTGGALAWTGADVLPWAAASLALLGLGAALFTVRARRARREREGAAA
ncbi:hypothetical protein DEU32_101166 [Curtobacterium sp. AG1037]|uniref:cohesin domain-containing protein n=1 Tax=Curtobacterium sp. AG1037 TaxID=2183990 RepID=UPI000E0C2B2A|nr:cohesin domain-containing protein [Curtobacterium sp. AG1037]RDI02262.1 hypothetical protein DEU32_101166 [Curtobacterium sp. AG1037]